MDGAPTVSRPLQTHRDVDPVQGACAVLLRRTQPRTCACLGVACRLEGHGPGLGRPPTPVRWRRTAASHTAGQPRPARGLRHHMAGLGCVGRPDRLGVPALLVLSTSAPLTRANVSRGERGCRSSSWGRAASGKHPWCCDTVKTHSMTSISQRSRCRPKNASRGCPPVPPQPPQPPSSYLSRPPCKVSRPVSELHFHPRCATFLPRLAHTNRAHAHRPHGPGCRPTLLQTVACSCP